MKWMRNFAAFLLLIMLLATFFVWWLLQSVPVATPGVVLAAPTNAPIARLVRLRNQRFRGSNEVISLITISNTFRGRVMFSSPGVEVLEDGQWVFHPWNSPWNHALNLDPRGHGELMTPSWDHGTWRVCILCSAKPPEFQQRTRERLMDLRCNLRARFNGDSTRIETYGGQQYRTVTDPVVVVPSAK